MTSSFWSSRRVAACLDLPNEAHARAFSAVVTDSRKIVPGALFVCIRGDRFDGHDFIAQAVADGAAGVILERGRWPSALDRDSVSAFEVDSPLSALRTLAGAYRDTYAIPFIAVAGSVGKTTTKELLASALESALGKPVLRTAGSENGYLGIALTLLKLEPTHAAAVIEIGIDDVGAMREHVSIVKPDGALVTAIGPEHMHNLRDLETVAREECLALDDALERGKALALQLDDPWIARRYADVKRPNVVGAAFDSASFSGRVARSTLVASNDAGTRISIACDGDVYEISIAVPGVHNARNAALAFAMGAALGLDKSALAAGMASFAAAFGRGEVSRFDTGLVVLRDYYNANPTSVNAALTMLAADGGERAQRWACLGDMLELGEHEQEFHAGLAASLMHYRIEHVLLYGERMKWLAAQLRQLNFRGDVAHFDRHEHIAEALRQGVSPKDRVLIKGSRGMRMENVWEQFRRGYAGRELTGT